MRVYAVSAVSIGPKRSPPFTAGSCTILGNEMSVSGSTQRVSLTSCAPGAVGTPRFMYTGRTTGAGWVSPAPFMVTGSHRWYPRESQRLGSAHLKPTSAQGGDAGVARYASSAVLNEIGPRACQTPSTPWCRLTISISCGRASASSLGCSNSAAGLPSPQRDFQ